MFQTLKAMASSAAALVTLPNRLRHDPPDKAETVLDALERGDTATVDAMLDRMGLDPDGKRQAWRDLAAFSRDTVRMG